MENTENEKHFKNTIALALDKKLPWLRLASILDEMTPTLEVTKQLVKVLLQELQAMQMILDQRPIDVQIPRVSISRIQVSNCGTESSTNICHTHEIESDSQVNESPKCPDDDEDVEIENENVFKTPGDGIDFELDSSDDDSFEDEMNSDLKESYNGTTLSIEVDETQIIEKNVEDTKELTENSETNPDDQEPFEDKIFSIEVDEGTETQFKEQNLDETNELTDSTDVISNPGKIQTDPETKLLSEEKNVLSQEQKASLENVANS